MKNLYLVVLLTLILPLFTNIVLAQCDGVTLESLTNPGSFEVETLTEADGIRNGPDYFGATIYYPTNATPPFSSIAIVPGYVSLPLSVQDWGPFYASHGIVTIIIGTNSLYDFPEARANALLDALETMRQENTRVASPLEGALNLDQLAVSGWSMGGGGAQRAAVLDNSIAGVVALCPYLNNPQLNHKSPVLIFSGENDLIAAPSQHADIHYNVTPNTTDKVLFEIKNGNHYVANTPNGGGGAVGRIALSWLKLYVEQNDCYCTLLTDNLLMDSPVVSKVEQDFECESDNDGIGDVCDNDIDCDGILNENDNCREIVNPNQSDLDNDGIGDVCDNDIDGDGVMNDVDSCPNTPLGEEVDANGCSESQLDNDSDGVMNDIDLCPNTPTGEAVDANGCFTLPPNNFTIEATGETCPNKKNGQILITANEVYNYVVSINGNQYHFTNNKTISDLLPGTYELCIEVPENDSFEQCYSITIEEGNTISGKSSVTSNKASIAIEQGTAPFNVYVNGITVLNTLNTSFTIDVKHGDLIEVKTAKSCEGTFLKAIDLFENIKVYPNPSKGLFEVTLPISEKEVVAELYTMDSQLISKGTYQVVNGKVQMSLENQPTGVYVVRIYLDTPVNLTIIKE